MNNQQNIDDNQTPLCRVAIQGIAGCFHDAAAREFFHGDITPVECDTFDSLVRQVADDASLRGLMAIENTIAGPLLDNHELLRTNNIMIVGEHKKRISHVLAALPGQSLRDIYQVESHPMALMQCREFLESVAWPAGFTVWDFTDIISVDTFDGEFFVRQWRFTLRANFEDLKNENVPKIESVEPLELKAI